MRLARLRALARAGASTRARDGPRRHPRSAATSAARPVPDDHRHLLHLVERRIVCACEACWALHSGDADYRPTACARCGWRAFECDEATWASLQIPIGLAFFMRSSASDRSSRFYPSPAGATESELPLESWQALVAANPVLARLDADGEALVVNRLSDPPQYAILPIDRCYELVGLIKHPWEGISRRRRTRPRPCRVLRAASAASRPRHRWGRRMSVEAASGTSAAWIPAPDVRDHRCCARRRSPPRPTMRFQALAREPDAIAGPVDRALRPGDDRSGAARRTTRRPANGSPSCSASPSGGRASTSASPGRGSTVTVPGFTGEAAFAIEVPCTYDLEVAAAKYFYALPDGVVPLELPLQRQRLLPRRRRRAADRCRSPGAPSARSGCRSRSGGR